MRNTALRLMLAVTLSLSMVLAFGCGDDDQSIARQYCEKVQSCNLMTAGANVTTCTETIEKSWNLIPSAKKTDCENATKKCMDMADCVNFANCVAATLGNC
jgi:hypothetical protein